MNKANRVWIAVGFFGAALWTIPAGAQCSTGLSDDAVQDCSAIYGGDGAPIEVQAYQPDAVILWSRGSDDSRTGFAGSGGSVRAQIARPIIGTRVEVRTDGGGSSGFDTGGDAGDVDFFLDSGRGVREVVVTANGGGSSADGTDGDAGDVSLEMSDIPLEAVRIEARGDVGGIVTVLLTNEATVNMLEIDADGNTVPGAITLDLANGTRVERLQLAPGAQTFRVVGNGTIGELIVGETVLTAAP
jgi:hypothetical protein